MSAVSLVPARERPYVDATKNDSPFSQVFGYNGIARLGHGQLLGEGTTAPFIVKQVEMGESLNSQTLGIKPSWHRLLGGPLGRDDGWLLPAALICAACVLLRRRRAGRSDPLLSAVVLWGAWLLVLATVFSVGRYLNSYYVAALSPAIATLCGVGLALFWRERHRCQARVALAAGVVSTAGYGGYLLDGGTDVPGWLLPLAVVLAVLGTAAALFAPRLGSGRRRAAIATAAVVACALAPAAVTSALAVTRGLGPFEAPYEPVSAGAAAHTSPQRYAAAVQRVVSHFLTTYRTPIAFATDSSLLAAPFVYYTGKEILPIGGYDGGAPAPSLGELQAYVAAGEVRVFLVPVKPASHDPRITWVQGHCTRLTLVTRSREIELAFYDCRPASA